MWIDHQNRKRMFIFVGISILFCWLLGFTDAIRMLETGLHQRVLQLTPANHLDQGDLSVGFPSVFFQFLIIFTLAPVLGCLKFRRCSGASIFIIILLVFGLMMTEILFTLLFAVWIPLLWPACSFLMISLVIYVWARYPQIKGFVLPDSVCQLNIINQYINQEDYQTAVLILKNCPFSDEMFEVAYELGMKLETREDWILARNLYMWLVQFDPGMQDFVDRMDVLVKPRLDDNTQSEITLTQHYFSHFQIVGRKASGATATVYDAFDSNTHKRIALKVLNDELNDDTGSEDVMSFLNEALTASQLDHPNIVRIHDADIWNNKAYIAMDYVVGYPMSERLRRKTLFNSLESLRIMKSVLSALVSAHSKSIVHGDIKPANIMYDTTHQVFILTDFGAAYSDFRDRGGEKKIKGTPAYMSPEQLSGSRIDGRSDLFSLAVTVFHLLSGVLPFSGEKLSEIKDNIINSDADFSLLSIPVALEIILKKAMSKKPYQRYADARQMLDAVERCEQNLLKQKQKQKQN